MRAAIDVTMFEFSKLANYYDISATRRYTNTIQLNLLPISFSNYLKTSSNYLSLPNKKNKMTVNSKNSDRTHRVYP